MVTDQQLDIILNSALRHQAPGTSNLAIYCDQDEAAIKEIISDAISGMFLLLFPVLNRRPEQPPISTAVWLPKVCLWLPRSGSGCRITQSCSNITQRGMFTRYRRL